MQDKKLSLKHDPALSNLIQIFDSMVNEIEPTPDNVWEAVINKPDNNKIMSFRQFYETDTYLESLSHISKMIDFKGLQEQFVQMAECMKTPEMAYKVCTNIADGFDPESREYYYHIFEPWISAERQTEYLNSLSDIEKKNWQRDINADLNALMFHKFLIDIKNVDREKERRIARENVSLEQILSVNFGLMDKASLNINKKSLRELYSEAKNGDLDSLVKVIQFDKTIFDHDWVKVLMLKATIIGDYDFFEKIAYAIKTKPPLGRINETRRIRTILITFWGMGLYRLSNDELVNLLDNSGYPMLEEYPDPDTFRRFVDREIRPLFPKFE
jgi:hypothetical protein